MVIQFVHVRVSYYYVYITNMLAQFEVGGERWNILTEDRSSSVCVSIYALGLRLSCGVLIDLTPQTLIYIMFQDRFEIVNVDPIITCACTLARN